MKSGSRCLKLRLSPLGRCTVHQVSRSGGWKVLDTRNLITLEPLGEFLIRNSNNRDPEIKSTSMIVFFDNDLLFAVEICVQGSVIADYDCEFSV